MTENKILKNEEKAVLALRSLYRHHGYLPFKMSKFEEYDFYAENKDFLVSDSVITFNDTDGRLLALKPDVTLSIIKNTVYQEGCKHRVYYDENVYRVSGSTHRFKEIMQAGLECIGDIDIYDIYEAIYLAAKSLSLVCADFVLDVSHMGVFSAVLDSFGESESFKKKAASLIAEKNKHETVALCREYDISKENTDKLLTLISLYGGVGEVLSELDGICTTERERAMYNELSKLCELISKCEFKDNIRLDFSVVNNMSYYNGVVFKGFLKGICEGVLSGGEYQTLMSRMGRRGSGVGFALYLDLLDELDYEREEYDVDVLLIYNEGVDTDRILSVKSELVNLGKRVSVQRSIPEKLRYKEIINLCEGEK